MDGQYKIQKTKYYDKNKLVSIKKLMLYNEKNKETIREIGEAYRQNNRDKICQLQNAKIDRTRLRDFIQTHANNKWSGMTTAVQKHR